MTKATILLLCGTMVLQAAAQPPSKALEQYIEAAQTTSPLIRGYRDRAAIQQSELARLKALYTHSRIEVSGDYLFVPIVCTDGGRTTFEWNAQSATKYYGYDLGESSGHLHLGAQWTQPLLGGATYNAAREQAEALDADAANRIRLEAHQLERLVTEQYLLCLLDLTRAEYADSASMLLGRQAEALRLLARSGLSKQSDLRLLAAEAEANNEQQAAALQSYATHLAELNLLCGIEDTTVTVLPEADIRTTAPHTGGQSIFAEQYRIDSLSVAASLHAFEAQYKPRLDLFVNAGMQTGAFTDIQRRLGWSAGLTFSWTIADGGQARQKRIQAQTQWGTIAAYRDRALLERRSRLGQSLGQMRMYDRRMQAVQRRIGEYDAVLADYAKEMKAGTMSVLGYINVLRSRTAARQEYMLLRTNKMLAAAAYNYWNK